MGSSQLQGLVFGALMAAMTVVFYAMTMVIPIPVHLPLPLALVYVRHGPRAAGSSAALACLLTAMFFSWFAVFTTLIVFAVAPGLVMGWAIAARRSPTTAGFATGMAAFFAFLLSAVLMVIVSGINPVDQMVAAQKLALAQMQTRLADLPPDQAAALGGQMEQLITALPTLFPMFLGFGMALIALFSYQLAAWIFPRLGQPLEPFPPMRSWTFPREFIWVYPLAVLLINLPALPEAMHKLAYLAMVSSQFMYVIQGMSLAAWWLESRQLSRRASGWVAVLAGVFPLTNTIVMLAGIIDLAFDFRKLGAKKQN